MAGVILEKETAVRKILNVRRVHTTRSRAGSVETIDHQICLAHLLRNTMFFVEYLPKEKFVISNFEASFL